MARCTVSEANNWATSLISAISHGSRCDVMLTLTLTRIRQLYLGIPLAAPNPLKVSKASMYMVWGCTTFILNFFFGGKQRQEQRTATTVGFTQGDENESGQCVYCVWGNAVE